jgi:hypothetical protein
MNLTNDLKAPQMSFSKNFGIKFDKVSGMFEFPSIIKVDKKTFVLQSTDMNDVNLKSTSGETLVKSFTGEDVYTNFGLKAKYTAIPDTYSSDKISPLAFTSEQAEKYKALIEKKETINYKPKEVKVEMPETTEVKTQASTSVGSMTLKEYADKTSARFIEVRQVLKKDDIEYFNDRVNDLIADRLKYAIFAEEDLNNRQYLPFINKLKENGFIQVENMPWVFSKNGVNPKEEHAKLTTQSSTSELKTNEPTITKESTTESSEEGISKGQIDISDANTDMLNNFFGKDWTEEDNDSENPLEC